MTSQAKMATRLGGDGWPADPETASGTKEMDGFFPNAEAVASRVPRSAGADLCTWGVGLFGLIRNRTNPDAFRERKRLKADAKPSLVPWSKARRMGQTRTSMEAEFRSKHLNAHQDSGGQGAGMTPDEMVMAVFAQSEAGQG